LAGDEMGNSQRGNNNAYCQDNEISWLDWRQLDMPTGRDISGFVSRLSELRHGHPSLRIDRYLNPHDEIVPGIKRVQWYDMDGAEMSEAAWAFAEGRVLGLRRACLLEEGRVELSLVLVNGSDGDIDFLVPEAPTAWQRVLDTTNIRAAAVAMQGAHVPVCAHALVLLVAQVDPEEARE